MQTQADPTLIELIRYNNWANAQVLAACQVLTPDQLATTTPGAYGTIHETLGHIIYAEADYVGRLTGDRPQPSFKWEEGPSVADLAAFAEQVAHALLDAVRRIPPDHMVHEEEDGQTLDYQAGALFIQVINHGIEHRTNITTILSGTLGLPELEVDGWGYLFSHPDRFALQESP
ncbi:MAG: DinB family protein [Chloroflexota bacterium]